MKKKQYVKLGDMPEAEVKLFWDKFDGALEQFAEQAKRMVEAGKKRDIDGFAHAGVHVGQGLHVFQMAYAMWGSQTGAFEVQVMTPEQYEQMTGEKLPAELRPVEEIKKGSKFDGYL